MRDKFFDGITTVRGNDIGCEPNRDEGFRASDCSLKVGETTPPPSTRLHQSITSLFERQAFFSRPFKNHQHRAEAPEALQSNGLSKHKTPPKHRVILCVANRPSAPTRLAVAAIAALAT